MKPMSSKNFARGIMGAVAMAGLVSFVERSAAADYWGSSQDGDPALPADKVEFASNWYVRGDLAYAQETFPKIAPDFSFDASPSELNTYSAGAGAGTRSTIGSGPISFSTTAQGSRRLELANQSLAPSC
jgi:hypothetical protein